MNQRKWIGGLLMLAAIACASFAQAQSKRDAQAEMQAAFDAAKAVAKTGPADVALKDQASLKLPEGYVFVPQPQADQMMKAMGNGIDPTRLGIIFPAGGGGEWMVVARYINSGYIKDDEARDWKTDKMLEQIKEGTEESNKERADLGIPAMEIVGWVQSPTYDDKTHRLVWSIESRNKGGDGKEANGINYNTFVLGREGFISLNLVTGMDTIAKDKDIAATLLGATAFNQGKSYGEFNASTDRVAEYGIAALVAGVAAKKLGFFAVIAAFLLKFIKVIGIAAIALVAGLGKLMSRKKDEAPADGGGTPTA